MWLFADILKIMTIQEKEKKMKIHTKSGSRQFMKPHLLTVQ